MQVPVGMQGANMSRKHCGQHWLQASVPVVVVVLVLVPPPLPPPPEPALSDLQAGSRETRDA